MATEYVFSRQGVEQTLTELMRQVAVNLGVLPDVALYLPSDKAGYIAARAAIITGGDEIVDIYGVGSGEKRGEKLINKVFLNLRQQNEGGISHSGLATESYDDNGTTKFRERQVEGSTMNLVYDVRTVTQSTEYDRLCTQIVFQGLTQSRQGIYVFILDGDGNQTNKTFLLRFLSSQEIKTPSFFERLYTFQVEDVWIENWDAPILRDNIPQLTRITSTIFTNNTEADIINI